MIADQLECHFLNIVKTPARTSTTVNFYIVKDGGLNQWGLQIYNRTLIASAAFPLDAGIPLQQIVDAMLAKLADANTKYALNFVADKFLCNLA